jgi:hypothetical protein
MAGDGPSRRCARCDEIVHDLSAMTPDAAAALLARGGACVRFRRAPDGSVLHDLARAASFVAMTAAAACVHPVPTQAPVADATPTAEPAPALTVRVETRELHDPVAGLAVVAISETGDRVEGETDHDGNARFDGLAPGQYRVEVRIGDHVFRQGEVTVGDGPARLAIGWNNASHAELMGRVAHYVY